MPSICADGFDSCITNLNNRLKYRYVLCNCSLFIFQKLSRTFTAKTTLIVGEPRTCNLKDKHELMFFLDASPGYFALTLENDIKMEATSTRRAGIERFTFPTGVKPYFVMDLSNDLPASWGGGVMDIFPDNGTIQFGGRWKPRLVLFLSLSPRLILAYRQLPTASFDSFGPQYFWYNAYSCYSLLDNGNQKLDEYGAFTSDNYGMDTKAMGLTHLNLSVNLIGSAPYQAGALVSLLPTAAENGPTTITLRVGVSFVSAAQACANLEEEVGNASFEDVEAQSKALWNDKLSKIQVDLANTDGNVTELLYSSVYRSFLTPNNATGETNGAFAGTTSPYFDSLVCLSSNGVMSAY